MKKLLIIALALLLTLPLTVFVEDTPGGDALVFDGEVFTALFLPDGRVVYVPNKKGNTLARDELRCVDRDGKLLWSCAIPAGMQYWGGPHQLTDGSFALVNTLADGKRYLEIISAQGEHLRSQLLPDEMVPLLVAGARVYGTLQGEKEHQMFQIDLNGQAQPVSFDIIRPNSAVMWAWPKGEGHMLLIRGKASDLEDFTQRTADQALVYLDETGTETLRSAYLFERNLLHGFEPDAAFNQLGGLTALVKDNSGYKPFNTFSIHVYAPLAEVAEDWHYAADALTIKPQLIDQRPDGGYTVWGIGKQAESDSSGFVFRMETDAKGDIQSFSAKQAEGCRMVRYIDNQPHVFYSFGPNSWLAPFDTFPEMEIKVEKLEIDNHG